MIFTVYLAATMGVTAFMEQKTTVQMIEKQAWTAAKFEGKSTELALPGLYVEANHDPVMLDNRNGAPLKIGDKAYKKALFCHAVSRILVKLPSAGKRFTAEVGLDHNDDTKGGRGSVVFSVTAGGKERFRSDVLHYGSPAVKVDGSLDGATEFYLEIGDAGDGIGWDQSVWGDAKVELVDGKNLWLSDLPLLTKPLYDSTPPFSFSYGGKPFAEAVQGWKVERKSKKIDKNRTSHTVVFTDPQTKLEVRCEGVEYADFPTVEWTAYLKNRGNGDTPSIKDLKGIDAVFATAAGQACVLNHWYGSECVQRDFEPSQDAIQPNGSFRVKTTGGRPTQAAMPYFNVQMGLQGRIVAIGWPGQWSADFSRQGEEKLRIVGGQEKTDFVLHPGEEVRTPLIALQFTGGDVVDAQNEWRRWFIAYNMPHQQGKPLAPQHVACSSHLYNEMLNANEANQKECIDGYLNNGIKLDYWWMDAGWYPNNGTWWYTGTWEPDTKRFPNGLRAISDYGRSKGVKTIVWFEPERVHDGTWIQQNHPEWLLSEDGKGGGTVKLLDVGKADALKWLVDHINKTIDEQGIDFYRQDYNINPLGFWEVADTPSRVGITENHYVTGYLAYWDGLLAKHPGMPIDTCASGGRRLDLETLRRSVPLLRSDYIFEPVGQQGHTYGLSSWVPYQGSGHIAIDPYNLRSVFLSSINTCWDVRKKDLDYPLARKLMSQWRELNGCLLGDYYPLTPYSLAADQWIAWQFNLPSEDRGMVQAFRRSQSTYESARYRLRGLDPKARYEVKDMDAKKTVVKTGRELMETGLLVTLPTEPSAALIGYRKVK